MKNKIGKQCAKCPWKESTNPLDIPDGYDVEKHKKLKCTISSGIDSFSNRQVMACHETEEDYCAGWVYNQLGPGNNIGLRFRARKMDLSELEVFGYQHQTFEDTLPKL